MKDREIMTEDKVHITLRDRISLACRKKRMSEFEDFYFNSVLSQNASNRKINILDLGGTLSYWQSMHFRFFNSADFTLLNLNKIDVPDTYENVFSVTGDATDLSEYADKQFDLVFSNSVIEHVGGGNFKMQKHMAFEMQRTGIHYYLQTPNKWFFMEPHFMLPFFQLFPLNVKAFLVRYFKAGKKHAKGMGFNSTDGWADNWEQAVKIASSVRLLTLKELKQLFPDAIIRKEKILFMTKSFYLFSK